MHFSSKISCDKSQRLLEVFFSKAAPSVRIPSPGDPSAYFAPISPAAKTNSEPQSSNSILSMLMMNSQGLYFLTISQNLKSI